MITALKECGRVEPDCPIRKHLSGISFRSALRLLLDELQLKYVVHNEVLLITSPTKAESDEYMATRIYPVKTLFWFGTRTTKSRRIFNRSST